jgi:hypothetical protein
LATSTGRPIRPKGVCAIANGFSSADPAIVKPSVSVAQGSTAFTRVFLGPSSAAKLYAIASNYSASSCFGKNAGKANADGHRSGVFASGISAAGANRVWCCA